MKFISVLSTAGDCFRMGRCGEDGAIFSGVCSRRTRGNRHRLENRKSQFSIRKNCFSTWESSDPGADCPDRLCNPHLWRYWKFDLTRCWLRPLTTLFEQEDALGDCLRSLLTYMFLRLHVCKNCVSCSVSTMGSWLQTPFNEEREEARLHWMELSGLYLRNLLESKGRWFGQMGVASYTKLICWWAFFFFNIFINALVLPSTSLSKI